MGNSNNRIYGTENVDEVISIYEGLSDHFTYRQKKFDRSMTGCERLDYERELDVFELAEEDENEYMLDALAELGIDVEEINRIQYNDEDNYENGILL